MGALSDGRAAVPAGASGFSRFDQRTLTLEGGLRWALTGRSAPLEVSLLGLAYLGFGRSSQTSVLASGQDQRLEDSFAQVGVQAGLAAERELTTGLSLRVATPLATVSWQRLERVGAPTGHQFAAAVGLAPRLELRLAF